MSISIHAPLTGSDLHHASHCPSCVISIHAPLTGSDVYFGLYAGYSADFNPRSPHRERLCHSREPGRDAKISIHAPLTGSDADLFMYFRRSLISIHAPLTGSDMFYVFCFQFQPISIHAPLTGSDHDLTIPINSVSTISIHAPLTGSDFRGSVTPTHTRHFNPRSPHRERRLMTWDC